MKQLITYESEATLFIKDLKAKDPQLEQKQQAGRALLWDRPTISLDDQRRALEARVAQKPYVYQTND